MGLPGEKIEFKQGWVFINGNQFDESAYITFPKPETFGYPQAVQLASDEYYVLGDNRTASSDSRVWGILPRDDIVGKVWSRVFPFSTADFAKTPTY